MGRVVSIWRYPLKSARGERLRAVHVSYAGVRGDRIWGCLDVADGTVASVKHPLRWGRLLSVRAAFIGGEGSGDGETAVTLHVPGRSAWPAGSAEADDALSAHLGRGVRLTTVVPEDARLHRRLPDDPGLVPEWVTGDPGEELVTKIAGATPGGRFVDYGPVHLVTTGELARLGRSFGRFDVSAVRFRPNLVIDAPADPVPGQELVAGDVVLRVSLPTPRCVVPGLDHGTAPEDRALLAALARHHRTEVPERGLAACFGAYAEVVQGGRLRVGQDVRLG
ncbi:MAG: MOSC domain-containing protein [Frankiaceae bacterium]